MKHNFYRMAHTTHIFTNRVRKILFLFSLLSLSIIVLLFFASNSSPLTPNFVGSDSAFFRLVGQGMTKGMLPYRDFFDMKGPYLFLIEYLAQLVSYGRLGIFIIECLNLFLLLYCTTKIFDLLNYSFGYLKKIAFTIPIIWIFFFFFQGGNTNEEFSVLPLCFCLYLSLKYLIGCENGVNKLKPVFGFVFGIIFGYLFFLRINNSAFMLACLFVVFLNLLIKKEFVNLTYNLVFFILGIIVVSLPIVLFFGINGEISNMFYNMFVLGFKYSGNLSFAEHLYLFKKNIPLVLLSITPFLSVLFVKSKRKNWKIVLLSILTALASDLAIFVGNGYLHYFMLMIPLLVLAEYDLLATLINNPTISRFNQAIVLILGFLILGQYSEHNLIRHLPIFYEPQKQEVTKYIELSKETCLFIDDRESVYTYDLESKFYVYNDIFPYNKYCDWQKSYILLIPSIEDELINMLSTDPPAWIVLNTQRKNDDVFETEVIRRYELIHRNELFELYSLNK